MSDEGNYTGGGSVTDSAGTPLTPAKYAQLKAAGLTFLLETEMEYQLFFE